MFWNCWKFRSHRGGVLLCWVIKPKNKKCSSWNLWGKKVDYLVATDAIGMGLNLNIDHIASPLKKYDGRYKRNLYTTEIGQIAGELADMKIMELFIIKKCWWTWHKNY